ncbi:MAG: 2Fe-2S iron-sulfur cluster-binding protein [Thermogutta sp.]
MGIVIVDGKKVEVGPHERLNGIQAAARAGIEIPHYCWHPGLSVVASCRMCLVEVGTQDPKTGQIVMLPKLVPACNTPAKDGTVLVTNSEKVAQARAMAEEDLLLRHPIDCPICDKAGECRLQDYHFNYGRAERRAEIRPFTSRKRDIGDVLLFVDRCIMCTRCVRFVREISGTSELFIVNRGTHEEIDVLPEQPLNNKLSGNVVDLCPVGALADKDFLYKQRVWFLRRKPSVCGLCSTGCSIWIEENQDRIHRIKPRENPFVNRWWICNDGRYAYPLIHHPQRLRGVWQRQNEMWSQLTWSATREQIDGAVRHARRPAVCLSPFLTNEEAYLACRWIKNVHPASVVGLGPIPRQGEDEQFPSGFTIAAEKCPNRLGVESVAYWFEQPPLKFEELLTQVAGGQIDVVIVLGGYLKAWIDSEQAEKLRAASRLMVADLFPSPLSDKADLVLGVAAYAEHAGSYVNRKHRLQRLVRAVRPPTGNRCLGSIFWELNGMSGLYQPCDILAEMARTIPYFSAASGDIPEYGLDLRINQLAEEQISSEHLTA